MAPPPRPYSRSPLKCFRAHPRFKPFAPWPVLGISILHPIQLATHPALVRFAVITSGFVRVALRPTDPGRPSPSRDPSTCTATRPRGAYQVILLSWHSDTIPHPPSLIIREKPQLHFQCGGTWGIGQPTSRRIAMVTRST